MLPQEEPAVRELHRLLPLAERPLHWYDLNPTSVAIDGDYRVVGARSVTVDPTGCLMHLQGLVIAPEARGTGASDLLFNWEIDRASAMGVVSFLSATWVGNKAMRKLFERNGFHHCMTLPNYYPLVPDDGWLYARHDEHRPPQCKEH